MKQLASLVLVLTSLFAGTLSAEEERILKLDLTKTENGNPSHWVSNPAINKKDKVRLVKDADGSAFLQAENWIHYHYNGLFPVNETDRIIVSIKARGRGTIQPGFYVFDRMGGFCGPAGKSFPLQVEWQEFRAEIPLACEPVKNGKYPVSYPAKIRPLIQMTGKADFKDYSISVIRNPILKEWVVNMPASTGNVKAEEGTVSLSGTMEYTGLGLRKGQNGDRAEFTFRIRGKGRLEAGLYAYDLKYDPARKTGRECGEITKSETIDSPEWKEVKFSVDVKNIRKNGKTFYVDRIREFFRTAAQDGASLELEGADFRLSSETIAVPDF